MVTLQQVLHAVATWEGASVAAVDRVVRAAIQALGLEIDASTGEVSVYKGAITISALLQAVAAAEGDDTVTNVEHFVSATIRTLGLDVNTITGEVYNQAEGVYHQPIQIRPRDDRWRAKRRSSR